MTSLAPQPTRQTAARVPDPGVRGLFSERSRWQARLDVEAVLARAEARLGIIPEEAAVAITRGARVELLDEERLRERIAETSHSMVALIDELASVVGEQSARWIHWGATTQNVTQTADVLILRQVLTILVGQVDRIIAAASGLAERTADMPMAGRTHGQHAVPITFGLKVSTWLDELLRHRERLIRLRPTLLRVLMGGAAGTYAAFGERGAEIQHAVADELGLGEMPVPSRAILDPFAELVLVLGLVSGTAGRIAREVYTLMKPEFGEAEEPIPAGVVGSSTMPHKRNPQLAQDVLSLSTRVRSLASPALEALAQEHEVDAAGTMVMDEVVELACVATADALARIEVMLDGIVLHPDRMLANLSLTSGLISSEPVMMALAGRIGRLAAHEAVYAAAQRSAIDGIGFEAALREQPHLSGLFADGEYEILVDPTRHLGRSVELAHETAARARAVLAEASVRTERS